MSLLRQQSSERREVVGEVNRTQIIARADGDSLWVEIRRLPSGKPWQFAPERARRMAEFLNRAASLVDAWRASNDVEKSEQEG